MSRYYAPIRTVDPASEPVTTAEAKTACRALTDVTDEDTLIDGYIKVAREIYEWHTGRSAFTQTWRWNRDDFEDEMELPMGAPLQSVSSITYYDTDGTQQTLSTSVYRVDTDSVPGRVVLKPDQSWPDVQTERGQAVSITYVAGHSTTAAIPQAVKQGMFLLIGHLYSNREAVQVGVGIGAVEIPLGVLYFWGPQQLWAA